MKLFHIDAKVAKTHKNTFLNACRSSSLGKELLKQLFDHTSDDGKHIFYYRSHAKLNATLDEVKNLRTHFPESSMNLGYIKFSALEVSESELTRPNELKN